MNFPLYSDSNKLKVIESIKFLCKVHSHSYATYTVESISDCTICSINYAHSSWSSIKISTPYPLYSTCYLYNPRHSLHLKSICKSSFVARCHLMVVKQLLGKWNSIHVKEIFMDSSVNLLAFLPLSWPFLYFTFFPFCFFP